MKDSVLARHSSLPVSNVPSDLYAAQFEYEDLCHRLLELKNKQERKKQKIIFHSFDSNQNESLHVTSVKINIRKANKSTSADRNNRRPSVSKNDAIKAQERQFYRFANDMLLESYLQPLPGKNPFYKQRVGKTSKFRSREYKFTK
jgi:hypothetical protein